MERRKSDHDLDQAHWVAKRRSLSGVTEALVELGQRLAGERDLEVSLRYVAEAAVRLTRSLQGTMRVLDESGTRLLTSARFGPSVHARNAPPFKVGEGFIGWVVVHEKAAFTNRVRSDPRFVSRPSQRWTPTGIMAVPLLSAGKCIGVLSVSRNDGRRYNGLDLNLLVLLGQLSVPHLEIARLKRLSESDPLTLLHNRRYLDSRLPAEIQRAQRHSRPLAVVMMDIDFFKRINDTLGHDAGDAVLCEVADRIRSASRNSDVIARVGGEEFLAVLPDTGYRQALKVADRIRKLVCSSSVTTGAGQVEVTLSAGVAALSKGDNEKSLVKRADQAMYSAKRSGRNRVAYKAAVR